MATKDAAWHQNGVGAAWNGGTIQGANDKFQMQLQKQSAAAAELHAIETSRHDAGASIIGKVEGVLDAARELGLDGVHRMVEPSQVAAEDALLLKDAVFVATKPPADKSPGRLSADTGAAAQPSRKRTAKEEANLARHDKARKRVKAQQRPRNGLTLGVLKAPRLTSKSVLETAPALPPLDLARAGEIVDRMMLEETCDELHARALGWDLALVGLKAAKAQPNMRFAVSLLQQNARCSEAKRMCNEAHVFCALHVKNVELQKTTMPLLSVFSECAASLVPMEEQLGRVKDSPVQVMLGGWHKETCATKHHRLLLDIEFDRELMATAHLHHDIDPTQNSCGAHAAAVPTPAQYLQAPPVPE